LFSVIVTKILSHKKNDILKNGIEYKIKTRSIDPADPFRGRYVAISVNVGVPDDLQNSAPEGVPFYVRLRTGGDGYAELSEVSVSPLEGDGVLKLGGPYSWRKWDNTVSLPFDRYYMQEKIAPKAESAHWQQSADTYVALRVKNCKGAISGLYIGNMRIEDYVRQ